MRQLQIRIAGWPGYHNFIAIDSAFGPATAAALTRFQSAYGMVADGIAGSATYTKIYALQDAACTPAHFSYAEMDDDCVGGWSGGKVSATTAKANALRQMWKLEALRHALGDNRRRSPGRYPCRCNSRPRSRCRTTEAVRVCPAGFRGQSAVQWSSVVAPASSVACARSQGRAAWW